MELRRRDPDLQYNYSLTGLLQYPPLGGYRIHSIPKRISDTLFDTRRRLRSLAVALI